MWDTKKTVTQIYVIAGFRRAVNEIFCDIMQHICSL
jgi:hypothetical protein